MPNYYEFLNIQPTASVQDLQVAIDDRYNQCRRLVTHHDPTVVNQANIALQSLEKIRETLLNSERKTVYDEALGLSGPVMGGLVDPQMAAVASVGSPMMVPPMAASLPTQPVYTPPQTSVPVDGWHCTKCNSVSQVGSLFCKACGGEIGQNCPKCGTMFEKTAKFCPSCGINPQQFADERARAQAEMLEKQRFGIRQMLTQAEAHLQTGLYGLAKDDLGIFEGLGNLKGRQVLCKQGEPEWQKAQALNQNANVTRVAIIKQNTLKITVAYAVAGGALGLISGIIALVGHISNIIQYQFSFDWSYLFGPFLNGLGLGIAGALAGVIGSGIYFYQWGGRRSMNQDLLLGGLAPIALAVMLAFGPFCFGGIILLAGLWFGLSIFGLSGNRRN